MRYLAQDTQPFRGGSFVGGASGTGLVYPSSIILFKHVLPEDPAADYLYRYILGDDYKGLAAQQSQLEFALFGSDWSGDPSKPLVGGGNESAAVRLFAPERGKLITRSDWTAQAADLHFDARPDAFIIGHDTVERGNFSFMALGTLLDTHPHLSPNHEKHRLLPLTRGRQSRGMESAQREVSPPRGRRGAGQRRCGRPEICL